MKCLVHKGDKLFHDIETVHNRFYEFQITIGKKLPVVAAIIESKSIKRKVEKSVSNSLISFFYSFDVFVAAKKQGRVSWQHSS